ncbi:MAG: AMP-binding protein [Bacilli bacterium]|nr:AMP-binding protein [Bacilli bacterium]
MKEKLISEVSKYDSFLAEYLKKNYDSFNLAKYVDYVASLDGNKQALCHVDKNGERREFSYKDLSLLSNKMANYLRKKGVKKGDVVALVLRSNYEFYIVSLALQKLGAVTLTLQYANKEAQYKSIFSRCNPKCVIADDYEIVQSKDSSSFVLDELNKSCDNEMIKLCTYPRSTYSSDWDYLNEYEKESDVFESEDINIYDLGYLFSTSGTTGEPKLVMHNYGFSLAHFFTGLWYGVEKGKKHYTIADSGWGMGTWNMCAVLLHQGIIYNNDFDRFNPEYVLNCIDEENVNSLCAPRAILVPLFNYLDTHTTTKPKLKTISSAGEKVDLETKKRCMKHFGVYPREGYGMTEIVLPLYEDDYGRKVTPLYSNVIVEKVPGLENGEIVVNGGKIGLLMGYLDKLNNTDEHYILYHRPPIDCNGIVWHTGDAGYKDSTGNVFCDGRLGNTVKVNDCLVNKSEVENVIKTHPYVYDCVVESKSDPVSGNVLYAYVELKRGVVLDEDMIKQYVKTKLPNYCRPKHVVFKKLDRTCNGKLKRTDLVQAPDKKLVLIRNQYCVC